MNSIRRIFLKNALSFLSTGLIAPILFFSKSQAQESQKESKVEPEVEGVLAEPGKDARSLGYIEVSNVSEKNCANCKIYTRKGLKNNEEVGSCVVIPKKLVKASGYCRSWSKK